MAARAARPGEHAPARRRCPLLSAVISYFGLRRFREEYSAQLAQKIEQRIETKQAKQSAAGAGATDEDAEDAEVARGDDTFR